MSTDVADGPALANVHPRAIAVHRDKPEGSARNVWQADVAELEHLVGRARVRVEGAIPVVAEITEDAAAELGLAVGSSVWLSVKATEIQVQSAP